MHETRPLGRDETIKHGPLLLRHPVPLGQQIELKLLNNERAPPVVLLRFDRALTPLQHVDDGSSPSGREIVELCLSRWVHVNRAVHSLVLNGRGAARDGIILERKDHRRAVRHAVMRTVE